MEIEPSVAIIIINWNKFDQTIRCVKSVLESDYKNYEIIVIDNNSDENPEISLFREFPEIRFFRNSANLGYTGANNQGLEWSVQNGYNYTWLLNNDTIITFDCLTKLIYHCEKHRKIGLAHPIIYDNPISQRLIYCGSFVDLVHGKFRTAHDIDEIETWQTSFPNNVSLWGTALLVRNECYKRTGSLDNRFFAYFEDMDYSQRIKTKGYECKIITSAKIYHERKSSYTGHYPNYYHFFMARNNYLFWKIHQKHRLLSFRNHMKYVLPKIDSYKKSKFFFAAEFTIEGSWNGLINQFGSFEERKTVPKTVKYPLLWFSKLLVKLIKFT